MHRTDNNAGKEDSAIDNDASDVNADNYAMTQTKTQTTNNVADDGVQHRRLTTVHRMDDNADEDNSATEDNLSDINTDNYMTMKTNTRTMDDNSYHRIQRRRPTMMHRTNKNADKDNSAVDNNT
jgi:hypothetical protein